MENLRSESYNHPHRSFVSFSFALIVLVTAFEAARADVSVRERLVEAAAATRLCPDLKMNRRVFERVAAENGMDMTKGSMDMRAFEKKVDRQVPRLLKFDRWIICRIGAGNFGPKGEIVKNLLTVR